MKRIEELLGRRLTPEDFHSVPTLNDVGPQMLEELRRLESRSQLDYYLAFHIAQKYKSNDGEGFIDEVVKGGADPTTWGFQDLFVTLQDNDVGHLLSLTWEAVRERLLAVGGASWCWQSIPNPTCISDGWTGWGAVGVRLERAPYWWRSPSEMTSVLWDDDVAHLKQIDESHVRLKLRRWIALRCSWWCRASVNFERDNTPSDEQAILSLVGVPRDRLSVDGGIALRALAREAAMPFDPKRDVRGNMGPDSWYAGDEHERP